MGKPATRDTDRAQIAMLVETMFNELYDWRAQHPDASLDEIGAEVTLRRRRLMGEWLAQLACQNGDGTVVEGRLCSECGQPLVYKGDPPRRQEHLEGEIKLKRAYYYCPACRTGIFPPRPPSPVGEA
jgi:hypothetical protein